MSIQITGATITSKTPDLSREQKADLFADLFGADERQLYVDEIPEDATAGNAMMADGMYTIFTNTIGRFVTKDKKNNVELAYLKNVGQSSFKMLLTKIPKRFLQGMYDFFKKIAETNRNEVMVQIFWNKVTRQYEMHVPEQQVAGASISFDRTKGAMSNGDLLWVMDVH